MPKRMISMSTGRSSVSIHFATGTRPVTSSAHGDQGQVLLQQLAGNGMV